VSEEEHLCFLQADKVINKKRYPLIFFDYECYQKDSKHVPHYIVAKKIQWIEYLSMKKKILIKHARNGEEDK